MTETASALGLLLDVDGPIASPVTRSIAVDGIAADLVALADAGCPIAFNTGRSDAFLREQVLPPLVEAGLSSTARVWGVCEKGAVWARMTPEGMAEPEVDASMVVPSACAAEIEALVDRHPELSFYDHTKRAMVSVEQRTDVANEEYLAAQDAFDAEVIGILRRHGLGIERRGERYPDADGRIDYRVDPTIISTDVESVRVGKEVGARRVLGFLTDEGAQIPRRWRTMGDSRTDYAMADWLHEQGFDVVHVDVRPSDGVPEKPYPIRHHAELIHDEAGAAYLRRWVRMLSGHAQDDADV